MFGCGDDSRDKSGQFLSTQTFSSDPDNGRFTAAGNSHKRVKIGIQRNDDPPFHYGLFENLLIAGGTHADFADMQRVATTSPENIRSLARQALIQQ